MKAFLFFMVLCLLVSVGLYSQVVSRPLYQHIDFAEDDILDFITNTGRTTSPYYYLEVTNLEQGVSRNTINNSTGAVRVYQESNYCWIFVDQTGWPERWAIGSTIRLHLSNMNGKTIGKDIVVPSGTSPIIIHGDTDKLIIPMPDDPGPVTIFDSSGSDAITGKMDLTIDETDNIYRAAGWTVEGTGSLNNSYWQIALSSTGYESLQISSQLRRQYEEDENLDAYWGPRHFRLYYSVDEGENWENYPTEVNYSLGENSNWMSISFNLPTEADDCESVLIRWYLHASGGMTPNNPWGEIKDVIVRGYGEVSDNLHPLTAIVVSPANEAGTIPINLTTLQWQYVSDVDYPDPVKFKILMHTSDNFNTVSPKWEDFVPDQENYSIPVSSFYPSGLNYNQTYYWKVIPTTFDPSRNPSGTRIVDIRNSMIERGDAEGVEVWNFTTVLNPNPVVAVEPVPSHQNPNVPTSTQFGWTYTNNPDHTDPVGFSFKIGKAANLSDAQEFYYEGGVGTHLIDSPISLSLSTTYYWQVIPTTNPDSRSAVTRMTGIRSSGDTRSLRRIVSIRDTEEIRGEASACPIWNFATEKSEVTTIEVEGEQELILPVLGSVNHSAAYTAIVKDQQGEEMTEQTVVWSVTGDITGISINQQGIVTITDEAVLDQEFSVRATRSEVYGELLVTVNLVIVVIEIDGNGVTYPPMGTHPYDLGSELTFTAAGTNGYEFFKWVVNGEDIFTSSFPFTIVESTIATAHFVLMPETIVVEVEAPEEPNLQYQGTINVPDGPSMPFVFTPADTETTIVTISCQYSTNTSHQSILLFANPQNLGAYFGFRFSDISVLAGGKSFTLSFPVDPMTIFFRIGGEWLAIDPERITHISDLTYTIDISGLLPDGGFRNDMIEFAGDNGMETLPVELSSFTANVFTDSGTANSFVELQWVSESETNMLGYTIYRSGTNRLFDAYEISQELIPAINSSSTYTYKYTDTAVLVGESYYYWLQAIDLDLTNTFHGPVAVTLTMEPEIPVEIFATRLYQNYPNPFNPTTIISYELKETEEIELFIYNLSGQLVKTLRNGVQEKGRHTVEWKGKDNSGRGVSSGVYFYRLKTSSYDMVYKMLMVK